MMIKADIQNQTIYILSDSQAALRAIASPRVKQLLVGNCIENLNMLSQNNQIQLMWVPGHSDIEGNERADTLAKNRAHMLCEIPEPAVPVSYSRCRLEVRYWVQTKHAEAWKQAKSCLLTKEAIRKTDKIPAKNLLKLSRRKLNQVLQILTGHGNLATHRYKMGKVQSPLCPKCHEADETPQHFVGDCPAYLNTRISHFGYHKIKLCDLMKNGSIFKLASFAEKTKRLEKI